MFRTLRCLLFLFPLLALPIARATTIESHPELGKPFKSADVNGTLVVYDAGADCMLVYNRTLPRNSLRALDTIPAARPWQSERETR